MQVRCVHFGFSHPTRRRRGMTLLEILLALTLTVSLLTGVYIFYVNMMKAREAANDLTSDIQLTRIVLSRIANDIRQVAPFTPGFGVGVVGERHSITIYRYAMPETDVFDQYDPNLGNLPPAKGDLRKVTWTLLTDTEHQDVNGEPIVHGLWYTNLRTLNQVVIVQEDGDNQDSGFSLGKTQDGKGTIQEADVAQGLETELAAPEIKYLEFSYFDGADWVPEWKGGERKENALPQAVMITVGRIPVPAEEEEFDTNVLETMDKESREELEKEHPDRFAIIVRLNQADKFLMSRVVNARSQFGKDSGGMGGGGGGNIGRGLGGGGFGK